MPRVKRGVTAHRRHKRVLAQATGFRGRRKNVYRVAKQAVLRAGQFAYQHRRRKKRDFRRLWIVRINAAAREQGLTYGAFMNGLKRAGVVLNRKMLAEMAMTGDPAFGELAAVARRHHA